MPRRALQQRIVTGSFVVLLFGVAPAPTGHADAVAYLVNVTMRPGYHFADADTALNYGHERCDKVSQGDTYRQVIGDIKADFGTTDDYQASYLLSQAVNELCPALIWQLRRSAAQ